MKGIAWAHVHIFAPAAGMAIFSHMPEHRLAIFSGQINIFLGPKGSLGCTHTCQPPTGTRSKGPIGPQNFQFPKKMCKRYFSQIVTKLLQFYVLTM